MKIKSPVNKIINTLIIGSSDFQRRLSPLLHSHAAINSNTNTSLNQAWSEIISTKPNCIIVEIGLHHSTREQVILRELLRTIRERYKNTIFVTLALMAPEKLYFGGDLLFEDDASSEPSRLVDTFLANPPHGFSTVASIDAQVDQMLSLLSIEIQRRDSGLPATPPLAADGWVHSLADPTSRELWMLWLPRYASYTNENPIITGPTGAGKTRLAKALHILSGRNGPFISITPRDFSSSELVQAELFGAVAGAYTGAVDKWGLVKSAENGTLFIDELQSIDKDLQGKLITFIENKFYRRVGSTETIEANVRFVFATNKPISEMVKADTLREDFAYRLERVQLNLAPLGERRLDIAAALAFALAKIRRQRPMTKFISGLTSDAYRLLFGYSWPGNLRQLENTVAKLCERTDLFGENLISDAVVHSVLQHNLDSKPTTQTEIYQAAARHLVNQTINTSNLKSVEDAVLAFKESIRIVALDACAGDTTKAAELLSEPKNLLDLFIEARLAENRLDPIDSQE
jgi:transcriptional regulator with AAA-type ATPase domain